jgi:hypothetical protein
VATFHICCVGDPPISETRIDIVLSIVLPRDVQHPGVRVCLQKQEQFTSDN